MFPSTLFGIMGTTVCSQNRRYLCTCSSFSFSHVSAQRSTFSVSCHSEETCFKLVLFCCVSVKKKHAECVPHSLSESEFWTRFFQSHYFHRDRISINSMDIFSECAKKDEEGEERLSTALVHMFRWNFVVAACLCSCLGCVFY